MEIIVPIKQVPDLVDELEIASSGTDLDREYLRYVLNEFDDQALEAALLLKEAHGGRVTVVALDMGEVDNVLFTAAAKGADVLVKITGDFADRPAGSHAMARIVADVVRDRPFDLICTGVQSAEDLDGQLAPLLGSALGLPHISVVSGIEADGGTIRVLQEHGGGVMARLEAPLPCVLGVQAAAQPPRYAPVSRVRQAMKETTIEEVAATAVEADPLTIRRFAKPESATHAEMIAGSTDQIVDKILSLLRERGLVKA
ncbi:MAG: electron transfer flavoprotein subunit beta/FixA family protein [Actinomycetota bacterium]